MKKDFGNKWSPCHCPSRSSQRSDRTKSCRTRRTVHWWSEYRHDERFKQQWENRRGNLFGTDLGRIGTRRAFAFTADATALTRARFLGGFVWLALQFEFAVADVAGTLTLVSTVQGFAVAYAAHFVTAVVAVGGIRRETLARDKGTFRSNFSRGARSRLVVPNFRAAHKDNGRLSPARWIRPR